MGSGHNHRLQQLAAKREMARRKQRRSAALAAAAGRGRPSYPSGPNSTVSGLASTDRTSNVTGGGSLGYPLNQWSPPQIISAETAVSATHNASNDFNASPTMRDADGKRVYVQTHHIGINQNDEGVLYEHRITVSFYVLSSVLGFFAGRKN